MAKLTLNSISSGYGSNTALNTNFDLIETALENTLSRDGTTPNTMSADLDMNGNDLLNVGDAIIGGISLAASVAASDADATAAAASAAAALVSETNAGASAMIAADAALELEDLEYKGAWVAATAYLKNNIVYYSTDGASYICLTSHTADADFAVDLGAARWGLLALRGAAGAGTGDMLKSENLSGLANYTTARSNMGLTIGTNVQAYDAQLDTLAAITTQQATDLAAVSTFMGTVLNDADADAARVTLVAAKSGAVTGTGITQSTGKILGRTTASTGAIEEITVGTGLTMSAGSLSASGVITSGTAQATTSGTSIDFTSIPAGTKRITVMLAGVSTNGTSNVLVQIGDSGGVETTGYLSSTTTPDGAGVASSNYTNGFNLNTAAVGNLEANLYHGSLTLELIDAAAFRWVATGMFGRSNSAGMNLVGGSKATSAELDRIRVTTANGTDAFDAGTINILYE